MAGGQRTILVTSNSGLIGFEAVEHFDSQGHRGITKSPWATLEEIIAESQPANSPSFLRND